MKKNVGSIDRVFRLAVAAAIGLLILLGVVKGVVAIALAVFAVVLVVVSFLAFCPLYLPFKINTAKKK